MASGCDFNMCFKLFLLGVLPGGLYIEARAIVLPWDF